MIIQEIIHKNCLVINSPLIDVIVKNANKNTD